MRKSYSSYSLLTLGGLLLAGSCSIIAEVDRTKIPQDGGTAADGGQSNTGGTNGTGGSTGGTSGTDTGGSSGSDTGGSAGAAGTSGEGGMGGEPGGMGGDAGTSDPGGMGGTGGVPGPECGDGVVDAGEACDDDDTDNDDGCSATCTEEAGWNCNSDEPSVCTPICGDGIDVGDAEPCDDRNTLACGTCAGNANGTGAGCAAAVAPTAATGTITPVTAAMLDDGTTFTLNDGYNAPITFEFDSDDSVTNTATLIAIDYTAGTIDADLQAAIIAAIDGVVAALLIDASAGAAPIVTLTHDRTTTLGNVAITKGGPNVGADVTVGGMAGGLAGNCPATTPCTVDADCASLDCSSSNLCTAI